MVQEKGILPGCVTSGKLLNLSESQFLGMIIIPVFCIYYGP